MRAHKKVPSSKPVGAGLSAAAGVVRDVAAAASASRKPEEHETNRLLEADDAGVAREQRDAGPTSSGNRRLSPEKDGGGGAREQRDAGDSRSAPSVASDSAKSGRKPGAGGGGADPADCASAGWEREEGESDCSYWWRAQWNFKPRGPLWLPQIVRMTWYLQIVTMMTSIQGKIDGASL